jgi:adenine deaminase
MKPSIASELMSVALGKSPADLILRGGDVLNVYTGEVLKGWAVAVKRKHIAYVGPDPAHTIGPRTVVIDTTGRLVIPGFIDAHSHIFNFYGDVSDFVASAAISGTTCCMTEATELFISLGFKAIDELTAFATEQPMRLFFAAPSMTTLCPSAVARAMSPRELNSLLHRPNIYGLGESYWSFVLQQDKRTLRQMAAAARTGKTVEGHSAGASGLKLQAYLASGVHDDHEPISADEVLERARLGIYVLLRRGDVRNELPAMASLAGRGISFRHFCLVSDGVNPKHLADFGYMDATVQEAIDLGFSPVDAIRMATLNPAEYFGLDRQLGGIAPGHYADLLVVPDLCRVKPELVVFNGQVIAENGALVKPVRRHVFSDRAYQGVSLPHAFSAADFSIRAPVKGPVKVRVIQQATPLVTREEIQDMIPVAGELKIDPAAGLLKVAVIDRAAWPGKHFTAFIRGWGLQQGAFAISSIWDMAGVTVIGADEGDMAFAVNRLRETQGGAVVIERGKILAELPLPVNGYLSTLPAEEVTSRMREIQRALAGLGAPFADPQLTAVTLSACAIPYLRLCESGLMDIRNHRLVGLFPELS